MLACKCLLANACLQCLLANACLQMLAAYAGCKCLLSNACNASCICMLQMQAAYAGCKCKRQMQAANAWLQMQKQAANFR
ncbi:hypothetical protein Tco_0298027 [Tanacetum coccineum]